MKQLFLFLSFLTLNLSSFCQTIRIDVKQENADLGQVSFLLKHEDISKFESGKRRCSFDFGLKLKPNLPDGTYEVFVNDTLNYRAFYKNKKKSGTWTYYYPNASIASVQIYENGLKEGPYKRFGKNGSLISEGNYSKDRMNGLWSDFSENGNLLTKYVFQDDVKVEEKEFYPNGNLKSEEYFLNGKFQGKNIEYFENGKIKKEMWYESDKLTRWAWYDENGNKTVDKSF